MIQDSLLDCAVLPTLSLPGHRPRVGNLMRTGTINMSQPGPTWPHLEWSPPVETLQCKDGTGCKVRVRQAALCVPACRPGEAAAAHSGLPGATAAKDKDSPYAGAASSCSGRQ